MAEITNPMPAQASTAQAVDDPIIHTTSTTSTSATEKAANSSPRHAGPRSPPLHRLYAQPVPIRVFPFPTITSNPLSLVHLAFAWISQILSPPAAEPSTIHTGIWSPETGSVHILDENSMMTLWRHGFFGKGTLSRSEPQWLRKEQNRLGLAKSKASEQVTGKRREERIQAKWERARLAQEAIERTRREEAGLVGSPVEGADADAQPVLESVEDTPTVEGADADAQPVLKSVEDTPTVEDDGPLAVAVALPSTTPKTVFRAPVGPLELLALPNSSLDLLRPSFSVNSLTSKVASVDISDTSTVGSGSSGNEDADTNTTASDESPVLKRRKSVRFSDNVRSTIFQHTDPPSPYYTAPSLQNTFSPVAEAATGVNVIDTGSVVAPGEDSQLLGVPASTTAPEMVAPVELTIVNKEILQLTPEEALFLVFGLGVLVVVDPITRQAIPTKELVALFCQHSYFPPRLPTDGVQPDDPFLINYAVYHHYRSMGWVPRGGIKFGVDFLLYEKGPVHDHAPFGLMVIPSYAAWTNEGRQAPRKKWSDLMGTNRVLGRVFKNLVLVYVDIPPPSVIGEDGMPAGGLLPMLRQYRIREIMVKRWSPNRNR